MVESTREMRRCRRGSQFWKSAVSSAREAGATAVEEGSVSGERRTML